MVPKVWSNLLLVGHLLEGPSNNFHYSNVPSPSSKPLLIFQIQLPSQLPKTHLRAPNPTFFKQKLDGLHYHPLQQPLRLGSTYFRYWIFFMNKFMNLKYFFGPINSKMSLIVHKNLDVNQNRFCKKFIVNHLICTL